MDTSPGSDDSTNNETNQGQAKQARSTLISRNVTIAGHRTSVRLEPEMWSGLSEICRRERMIMHDVCTNVSMRKQANTSLTAAIRVFVMAYFRAAATEDGHSKAGHGYGVAMAALPAGAAPAPRPSPNNVGMSAFAMSAGKMDGTRRF